MKNDPKSIGAKCGICPLGRGGNPHKPVCAVIPVSPVGILVGDAPRKEDTEATRPFSGQTGEALAGSLSKAGLSLRTLIQINAVCCEPPTKKDWAHLGGAVEACRPAFVSQLEKYKHLPVLLMGKWAFQAWTGRAKAIDNARGFVRNVQLKGQTDDEGRSIEFPEQASRSLDGPSEGDDPGDAGTLEED